MSAPTRSTRSKPSTAGLLPVFLFACWLISMIPASWQSSARAMLLDAIQPVQLAKQWAINQYHQLSTTDQLAVAQLQQKLQHQRDNYQLLLRQKELQLVSALNKKSDRQDAKLSPFNMLKSQSWAQTEVIRGSSVWLSTEISASAIADRVLTENSITNRSIGSAASESR